MYRVCFYYYNETIGKIMCFKVVSAEVLKFMQDMDDCFEINYVTNMNGEVIG